MSRRIPEGPAGHLSGEKPHRPHVIVGIGASAGGLEAFSQLLQHLPTDTGMAFVLVQHLDPARESALSDILSRATSLPVRELASDQPTQADHIYVIPPNADLSIADGVLKLEPRRRDGPHRSIDSFFEALAQDQRERAVGVILSGTATDGTLGLEAIKAEGGITFAQDDSAKYDSMPRSAIAAGCVDFVLTPEEIAKELARIAKHPYVAGQLAERFAVAENERASATAHEGDQTPLPSGGHGTPRTGSSRARAKRETSSKAGDNGFRKVLLLLRNHCGVDFSLYKSTTIQRRIARRMVLNKQDSHDNYAQFLRGNAKELDALYSDVLISVTSFFRNPEAFDVLKRKVFPKLLQQRGDEPFRVWVLGCSTGQEAYSIAMAFVEAAEKAPRMRRLQVFATDLNDALLDKARHGLYAKSLAQDISPERLRQFFVEEQGGYRVVKSLREMVVFARQNLITDPPFSRMDLVSCRNLLIYLEPNLQQKLLPTFHYALKPEGFLLLGASESIGNFTDLFQPLDKKAKVYSKKAAPTPAFHLPMRKERGEHLAVAQRQVAAARPAAKNQGEPAGFRAELTSQREADRVTINKYSPPGVLVNSELQILQFRGPTSAYLEPPTGKASFDVLKMARQGLMLPLRAALNKAKKENKPARRENVRVGQNGSTRVVNIDVIPLKNLRERCFLILFEDAERSARASGAPAHEQSRGPAKMPRSTGREEARHADALEQELAEMRDYLQSVLEQHDAANEELQASNEEVQSANEELQSINEELETSKEELESANEELTTVNEEMANRNTELNRLNGDLVNLQTSTKLAILLLARDLTIRRFSVQAEKQFNLLATDIGRPVSRVRHNLDITDLEQMIEDVIANVRESEREVRDKDGHWYSVRVRPYLTLDNKVDGAVLLLVSIDELKRTEQKIKAAQNYAEAIIRTARDPIVILRADLSVNTANEGFYKAFKTTPDQAEGRLIFDLAGGAWRIPKLRLLLEEILPRNSFFNDFEVSQDFPHIGRRTMLLNARRLDQGDGVPPMVLLAIEDVTERLRADAATAALAAIINSSHDAIISKDLNSQITSWNDSAERLFGYKASEAIGQPITMLFPPDRLHEESEIMERIKRGERIGQFDTVRVRKEGSTVEVSVSISPITDPTGLVTGASKIARDITKRKTAEALVNSQRQALQLLAEDVPLSDVLGFLMSIAERYSRRKGILAAITPLNDAGTHFQRSIGASLPDAFNAAVEGLTVDSPTDFCAEAVRRREAVAVRDFNTDAAWQPFGEFVAPYGLRSGWSAPIISSSGKVLGTFANYYRHAGDPTPHSREMVDMVTRTAAIAIERKQAEEALRESEERLRLAQRAARVGTFEWNIQSGVNTWTPEMEKLHGLPPGGFRGTQEAWEQLVHPDDHPKVIIKQAIEAGLFEGEWRVIWPDGTLHWISGRAQVFNDESGQPLKLVGVNIDITERKQAEERERLLANELAHRTKNLLAVVQAIVSRSLSGTRSLAEAREVAINRIHALASSQTALAQGGTEGALLAEIVSLELQGFSDRVTATGPEVSLNARTAETFALLLHELATNATKYGALSRPGGRVAIDWSIADARFRFRWQERGGPSVSPPTRKGFGRTLIEVAAAQAFSTEPTVSFAPEGLTYDIDAPLAAVVASTVADGTS